MKERLASSPQGAQNNTAYPMRRESRDVGKSKINDMITGVGLDQVGRCRLTTGEKVSQT